MHQKRSTFVLIWFSNPNAEEHYGNKNDAILPVSREKSRFRSLTWEQYDPVHQKYLEIGNINKMNNFVFLVLDHARNSETTYISCFYAF